MTHNAHDLMDAFLKCLVVDEAFADEIADVAHQCRQDGNHGVAAALMNISRNHRIKGMESRAKLTALSAEVWLAGAMDWARAPR